ncbi:T9SS type A sorting domain-containing protein [Chryseobacterium potabilaquae]|uniref:Secretion system C-terminal sorting domain-containing protein n=1 Tax=Chryseobacterium potabilaquae TaxID=2675057 RepID=A0A6N4XDL1_9FLAO|nr:T9SS type A sorting domain-containing protein [Chryseobacterium potabilaquae]CAA7196679.1 hypothetical protein CHRY9293_02755 [Chryseobacterium potabilaquae]
MTKKIFFKQLFQSTNKLLLCIMIVGATLFSTYRVKAQSCSPVQNLFYNGTTTINGIHITRSSAGDVTDSRLGPNRGAWSLKFTFDKPVNNLIFMFPINPGLDYSINAHFNTNGGPVAISTTYDSNNNWIVNGNTVTNPYNVQGGTGYFKITSPNDFTTITINGDAFPSNPLTHYSSLTLCSSSEVLAVHERSNEMDDNAVTIYPNPVKNMISISSKENLKSYKIIDGSGKLVLSSSLKGNKQEVNLSSVQTGTYVISVETDKQRVALKLIKE